MKKSKPNLSKKPLIEAIFELRWQLKQKKPNLFFDPHYKIFLGRIYDRVISEYPHHEELPSASMPEELAAHIVQHRFRKSEGKWPLIQIGPGLITLNDTDTYTWKDFQKRAHKLLSTLFEAYPQKKDLKFVRILVRYIDGLEFDFEKEDALQFLQEKMKTKIEYTPNLFDKANISSRPAGLDFRATFQTKNPKGAVTLKFARGLKNKKNALIWETILQSLGEEIPRTEKGIQSWLEKAHNISDDWFFKIIDGELLKRFK